MKNIRAWWRSLFDPPPVEPADEKMVAAMDAVFDHMDRAFDQMSSDMDAASKVARASGKPSGTSRRGSTIYRWKF